MAEIDKSMKLVFNEFTRAISEVPLEVYYQTIVSDQYSANGFQFNIKQPGTNALLDCDIWIQYTFLIKSTGNNYLRASMERVDDEGPDEQGYPTLSHRFALRGGNVGARCLQNLSVQVNNTTLNVQPYKYMDVLNRIYISNDMSEHEFSASGGRFDEGNHGCRTDSELYKNRFPNTVTNANGGPLVAGAPANNTRFTNITWADHFVPAPGVANALDVVSHLRPLWPMRYEWYNPGFSRRFEQFVYKCRTTASAPINGTVGNEADAASGDMFNGNDTGGGGTQEYYTFICYERLPIPLFKMYSSDGNYGVIPNIIQMQIQGNFLSTFIENLVRTDDDGALIDLHWTGVDSNVGKLFLRWYTPPMTMAIPREISIPYPKINTWSVQHTIAAQSTVLLQPNQYNDTNISQYNITLEAIPDLLLIYVKYAAVGYSFETPDDYLLELVNLTLNIDNASGKINQITSLDLYQKWKKIIKHQDSKIITYDEWRKYCCVACLQPEDYGCRYGPGYSNQTTLGITGIARNWHNNPSIWTQPNEPLGGEDGGGTLCELIVTTIYNKNRLIIRADGTAQQELTKLAADFSLQAPPMGAVADMRNRLL